MSEDTSNLGSDRTARATEESNRRRSKRVLLRVPVLLSAVLPGGKPISIQAHTLVVNAHGGLLDIGMELLREQKIRLSNLKTEMVTSARVVRVEGSDEGRFSVAFEFDVPSPYFWPINFLPADWTSVQSAV